MRFITLVLLLWPQVVWQTATHSSRYALRKLPESPELTSLCLSAKIEEVDFV